MIPFTRCICLLSGAMLHCPGRSLPASFRYDNNSLALTSNLTVSLMGSGIGLGQYLRRRPSSADNNRGVPDISLCTSRFRIREDYSYYNTLQLQSQGLVCV
jgi:hypothetical protein